MTTQGSVRLPAHWSRHVKAGVLHAISLASVALVCARARIAGRHRLQAQLEQANTEIVLLREELTIKDGRWERSLSRRRPHYTPVQRMRILQLRAARGWNLEQTAKVFLLDLQTLLIWMRRVDEDGERALIKTVEPVNRYPDFVRLLVRQLKRLLPAMGSERIAQTLARLGLALSASTIRRCVREPHGPEHEVEAAFQSPRRAIGRRPGDVWHVDLTAVPTRAGFWVPWAPFSLPQRWPFCWWVAVVVDQVSRRLVSHAFFRQLPSSQGVQALLERAIRDQGSAPRCIVSDKGRQFSARSYRRWCRARHIRVRFGHLGEPCSIPIVERFIRSMKQECFRILVVPLSLDSVRRELAHFAEWYNRHRPHSSLAGQTPQDVIERRSRPARIEPRTRWPYPSRHRLSGQRLALDVNYVAGRKHLPVIMLRRAALPSLTGNCTRPCALRAGDAVCEQSGTLRCRRVHRCA